MSRRTFALGTGSLLLAACSPHPRPEEKPPRVHPRPLTDLPTTTLSWLSLRDHFLATVGPNAGRGSRLGPLLVLADATFAPRSRFPLHPHREMEILSVVLEGTLSHHGDQAHGMSLGAGHAQLISSRSGMVHAEGNDTDAPTRMLQIWFEPDVHGGPPAYFDRQLPARGRQIIAGDEVMPLRADARVWWVNLEPSGREELKLAPRRCGYLLAATGALSVQGEGFAPVRLATGEGAAIDQGAVEVASAGPAVALWFDLPA